MFLIRADGNAKIGAGHLMRCLTIGAELAKRGGLAKQGELARQGEQVRQGELVKPEEILFLCADEMSADLVRQYGFRVCVLGTDYCNMESELPAWERLLNEKPELFVSDGLAFGGKNSGEVLEDCDCLIPTDSCGSVILVDSYYVTDGYLESLRRFGTVVLLDDMGTKRYPVDAVINYNAPADPDTYKLLYERIDVEIENSNPAQEESILAQDNSNPAQDNSDLKKEDFGGKMNRVKMFIGSRYAPIREQFLHRNYEIREKVQSVLITTGGGDSENIAGKILDRLYDDTLEYHLIVGQFNPHYRELKQLEDSRDNIMIHSNVTDMAGLMEACDLAITAGGSTIYELAALGVPFVCFSYAENQEALTEYIGSRNIAGFAGAFHKAPEQTLEQMQNLFQVLVEDESLRRQYFDSERTLIDGQGAVRLAQALRDLAADAPETPPKAEKTGNLYVEGSE